MTESDSTHPSTNPAQKAFENVKAGRDIKADIRQESNIRIEESVVGSAIVSGSGNTIYVIHQTTEQRRELSRADTTVSIGPNPYKGLAAFTENDANRYFGREEQVQRLWQRLQNLVEQSGRADAVPRFLPILGPSGCGKSSLARAGFIPALARRPLPGKEQMRVAVLVPGTHPVEALAGVLAKVATQDPMPVTKTREFATELNLPTAAGLYDGMRRIADLMPQIKASPLVVLIDQFEEVYSLCKDTNERQAFIENLLCAASDPTGNLSVIITLRSDFLGETQRHPMLNQVIGSDQSVIVPAMTEAELRCAIAEPAKQAGHPLDESIVDLLVKDTEGREGALPLLQFALTQIWEGLSIGKTPISTYREIGGVGGALAQKAQELYDGFDQTQQTVTRRIFRSLVHFQEDSQYVRRRLPESNLISKKDDPLIVQGVINRFSQTDTRLLTRAGHDQKQIVEVTHEALFKHWPALNAWLKDGKLLIQEKQRLENAASEWKSSGGSQEYLLLGKRLESAQKFIRLHQEEFPLSTIASDYVTASLQQRHHNRTRAIGLYSASALAVISVATLSFWLVGNARQQSQYEAEKAIILSSAIDTPYQEDLLETASNILQEANALATPRDNQSHEFLDEAIRYYRKVILFTTNSEALKASPSIDCQSASRPVEKIYCQAVDDLVSALESSHFQTLSQQIQDDQIGYFRSGDLSEFENLFSEGALQTTYSLLWRDLGIKADVDDVGPISEPEAERIPCQFLERLEQVWIEETENRCGWYDRGKNRLFTDPDCNELNNHTLISSVVEDIANSDYLLGRLQACQLIPNNVIER